MYKWIMFSLIIGACIFAGVVMTVGPLAPQSSGHEAAGAGDTELKIVASNWKFDQEEYKVAKGSTVMVSFKNAPGGGVHGMEIEGMDVILQDDVMSEEVTFDKAGEYIIRCTIACGEGHVEMFSTLIVE